MKHFARLMGVTLILVSCASNGNEDIGYTETWYGYKYELNGEAANPGIFGDTKMSNLLKSNPESRKEFNKFRVLNGASLLVAFAIISGGDTNSEIIKRGLIAIPVTAPLSYNATKHLKKSIDIYNSKGEVSLGPAYINKEIGINITYFF